MRASSAQLMVCEGGMEVTRIFMRPRRGEWGRSKGGGAALLGAICAYEVLPIPSKFSFGGKVR
jgi:hypothetical protein